MLDSFEGLNMPTNFEKKGMYHCQHFDYPKQSIQGIALKKVISIQNPELSLYEDRQWNNKKALYRRRIMIRYKSIYCLF